jgi:hypothetical protein
MRPTHNNTLDSIPRPYPTPRQTLLTSPSNPQPRPNPPTPKASYPLLQPTRTARRMNSNSSNTDIRTPRSPSPSKLASQLGPPQLPVTSSGPARDQRPPRQSSPSQMLSQQNNPQNAQAQHDWSQSSRAMSPGESTSTRQEPQYMHFKVRKVLCFLRHGPNECVCEGASSDGCFTHPHRTPSCPT